ncbi:MAG: hypothetical protein JO332_09090 [Planctomycetaceae bacterium]|nr:hypothetical protein [Planctomycetaceae bacterium]
MDLEKHRAVVLLKRRYCRDCTNAITAGASASTAPSSVHRIASRIAGLFSHGSKAL